MATKKIEIMQKDRVAKLHIIIYHIKYYATIKSNTLDKYASIREGSRKERRKSGKKKRSGIPEFLNLNQKAHFNKSGKP